MRLLCIPLAASLAGLSSPVSAAPRRNFPEGYWKRTTVAATPCEQQFHRAEVAVEAEKPTELKEEVLSFLHKNDAFFFPSGCQTSRYAAQPPPSAILVWVPEGAMSDLQKLLLRGGLIKKWQGLEQQGGNTAEDLADKWEVLTDELKANRKKLADFPLILALVQAEIERLAPYADFSRQVKGKRLLAISIL